MQQVIDDFKSDIIDFNKRFKTTIDKNVFRYVDNDKYYYFRYGYVDERPNFINKIIVVYEAYEVEPYETLYIKYRKI